jgi:hypothetical protein
MNKANLPISFTFPLLQVIGWNYCYTLSLDPILVEDQIVNALRLYHFLTPALPICSTLGILMGLPFSGITVELVYFQQAFTTYSHDLFNSLQLVMNDSRQKYPLETRENDDRHMLTRNESFDNRSACVVKG